MRLSSASEPQGLKSKHHYVVLHYDKRHDLLTLPESYSDLEREVKRLYNIERGHFYVETDDLNICKEIRVRIPKEAWADIALIVGNVYVMACPADPVPVASGANPKSVPSAKPKESDDGVLPKIDKETLYQRVVNCAPKDAAYILESLSTVRKGNDLYNLFGTGIKHRPQAVIAYKSVDLNWTMRPKSIFVIQITCPQDASPAKSGSESYIHFGRGDYCLQFILYPKSVKVSEYNGVSEEVSEYDDVSEEVPVEYGKMKLPHSWFSPGEHTFALINHQGNMHFIFDFCKSFSFPNKTLISGKPDKFTLGIHEGRILNVDVFEFEK